MWTPDPSIIVTAEQKLAEQQAALKARFEAAIQAHIDTTAQEKNYADGFSCATYVNSTNEAWKAEAEAFVAWRDSVWLYAYTELAKVEAGTRELPAIEDFIAELPALEWPE